MSARQELAEALENAATWLRRVDQLPTLEDIRFSEAKEQTKLCVELLKQGRRFRLSHLLEQVLAELVVRGRKLDVSWAELGRGMGMTPQGVTKLVERRLISPAAEVGELRSSLMPQLKTPHEKQRADWALSKLRNAVVSGDDDGVEYAVRELVQLCRWNITSITALPVLHWKGEEINFFDFQPD